jgi:hypothetical protein
MNVRYETARRAWPTLIITLALIALTLSLARCDSFVEEHYCAGYPEVLNPIADIGLVAGAELYARDLESAPYVFGHSHGAPLWYEVESSNRGVAKAWVDRGVLTVEARNPGSAIIYVDAIDDCDAYITTEFVVEVYPYAPSE